MNTILIDNIDLSKSSLWVNDRGYTNLSCVVSDIENRAIKYKVLVNDNLVDTQENFIPTPITLDIRLPLSIFTKENNFLELIVENEVGQETIFTYTVTVENRDTTIATRLYDFPSQFIHDTSKTTIALDKGAGLKEGFVGKDTIITTNNSNINTTGRRTIEKIEVVGNEDTIEEATIVEDMTLVGAIGEGYIWKKEINLEREIIGLEVKLK